jgi:NAD(P)H dehydrogenase (quinone)
MILITGATGHLGHHVVTQLLKTTPTNQFAVFTRTKEKAQKFVDEGIEIRIGDFNDRSSLESAFVGVEKLLLISTMEMNRFTQHKNVIDAAKKAGVQHILYTGLAIEDIHSSNVKDIMLSHFATEAYLLASGLDFTFLRNTMYTDAIPLIIGEKAFEHGIHLPAGEGKVPYALRREMGEGIANLLLQSGHENQIYNITGEQAYSYQDIAQALSELSNQEIKYTNIDENVFEKSLIDINTPNFMIYLTKGTILDIQQKQYEVATTTLKDLLGRSPLELKAALKELYQL